MGNFPAAATHLRQAAALADAAGLRSKAADARRVLVNVLAELGDIDAALEQADLARPGLRGVELGRLHMNRSLVYWRAGRVSDCLDGYDRALAVFRRAGARRLEGHTLSNRGLAHADLTGDLAAAEADLARAEALLEELEDLWALAKVRHNLGIVAARLGDAPRALWLLERAEEVFRARQMNYDAAILPRDRCAIFLSVRLVPEARASAEQAIHELAAVGAATTRVEAQLLLAEALLLEPSLERAAAVAQEARRAFAGQGREGWAAVARLVETRARWQMGRLSDGLLRSARRLVAELEEAGFRAGAIEAAIIAARVALELDRPRVAARELSLASRARHAGSDQRRARAWHAEALIRLSRGDRRGAKAALRAGLRAVERTRALLGASELRAHFAGVGDELAALGLRIALEDRSPRQVLAWAERWRAGGLWTRPARPPDDKALAADLGELRQLTASQEAAALERRATVELARRRVDVEQRIIRRTRTVAGQGANAERPSVGGVAGALGRRALLEVVEIDGRLLGLVVVDGRVSMRPLGERDQVFRELDGLRFGLRRLVPGRTSEDLLRATRNSVAHAALRLDDLLLAPVRHLIGERSLVIVPTGILHALPWAALPSCTGRPLVVAPSATLWLRAERDRARNDGTDARAALIAGPGLVGADDEVAQLARVYLGSRPLVGARATAVAAMEALDGADLAHIAAHGLFRADNPMFSSLRLADGGLTVYDLERLARAPRMLVLSACDSGLSAVRPGDELMGLAAALLSLGTRSVVASVGLAPDWATRPIMLDFHRLLHAGADPAEALAAAQAAVDLSGDEPDERLAALAAFVCLGAG
jgi:CHAT domain